MKGPFLIYGPVQDPAPLALPQPVSQLTEATVPPLSVHVPPPPPPLPGAVAVHVPESVPVDIVYVSAPHFTSIVARWGPVGRARSLLRPAEGPETFGATYCIVCFRLRCCASALLIEKAIGIEQVKYAFVISTNICFAP